ncbi:MAG: NADH-quinone oxidoreductase subunit M, partial [Polyangiaceae bacterium]|nr:NADH-quinone oxidoreductase subunit M [Polyangiaceae bacterium]
MTFLIFVPLVASVAVMFLPRQGLKTLRYFTYGAMGLTFVASLWTLKVPMTPGWHFQHIKEWIPGLGIRYHVALDGISLWLVLLTTFITPIAAFASFGSIKTRVKELCFAFLFLEAAMIGAFVALDLFLFYVFWELMLVPMYLMIGIWGGTEKIKAAVKFFIYTMAGSMLLLAAIVYLVWTHQKITGEYSFDYLALARVVLPKSTQFLCFWGFSIAFFVKVPMWPVHTWLPDAHVQAPTGGSVILAAVMLKLGTYAYMRFSMILFPFAASEYAPHVAGVAILGGIVWAALVAWKQDDVKKLIAYSSVAHLGYIMLGLFGATPAGMQGAVIQMVNHGISTGALFLLVGVIYDRRHTRLIKDYGGIAKVMPVYATVFLIATFASVGVPGTNGFVGEFMVIMGTFGSRDLGNFAGVHAVGAAFGVILAAVYMLSVVQKVFFGKLDAKNRTMPDLSPREAIALAPLVVMIFAIGFFPNVFLSRTEASVNMLREQYVAVAQPQRELYAPKTMTTEPPARLLPASMFEESFLTGAPKWAALEKPEIPAAPAATATATAAPAAPTAPTPRPVPTTKGSAAPSA